MRGRVLILTIVGWVGLAPADAEAGGHGHRYPRHVPAWGYRNGGDQGFSGGPGYGGYDSLSPRGSTRWIDPGDRFARSRGGYSGGFGYPFYNANGPRGVMGYPGY